MTPEDYAKTEEELRTLLFERLDVQANSFEAAVRKAGHLLPSSARTAAREFIAMGPRLRHPKIAAKTDPKAAEDAARVVKAALEKRRPGARRTRQRWMLISEIGSRLFIVIAVALILWAVMVPAP